jgi:hypothetical protein
MFLSGMSVTGHKQVKVRLLLAPPVPVSKLSRESTTVPFAGGGFKP